MAKAAVLSSPLLGLKLKDAWSIPLAIWDGRGSPELAQGTLNPFGRPPCRRDSQQVWPTGLSGSKARPGQTKGRPELSALPTPCSPELRFLGGENTQDQQSAKHARCPSGLKPAPNKHLLPPLGEGGTGLLLWEQESSRPGAGTEGDPSSASSHLSPGTPAPLSCLPRDVHPCCG